MVSALLLGLWGKAVMKVGRRTRGTLMVIKAWQGSKLFRQGTSANKLNTILPVLVVYTTSGKIISLK